MGGIGIIKDYHTLWGIAIIVQVKEEDWLTWRLKYHCKKNPGFLYRNPGLNKFPAASYSPTQLPKQYHRR